jgi:hypothetical protein
VKRVGEESSLCFFETRNHISLSYVFALGSQVDYVRAPHRKRNADHFAAVTFFWATLAAEEANLKTFP